MYMCTPFWDPWTLSNRRGKPPHLKICWPYGQMCLYIVISGVLKQFEKVEFTSSNVNKCLLVCPLISFAVDKGFWSLKGGMWGHVGFLDWQNVNIAKQFPFGKRDLLCCKNWDYSNILPALPPSKCYFRSPPGATDTVWGSCFAGKIPLLMLLALKLPFLMLLQETRIWPRRRFYKWTNSSPPWKRWKILQNNFCLTKFVAS